jgi:predicted RNA-binding Zn ribbon-like protein
MAGGLPPPFFLADSPGIDFLNSLAHPAGQPVEWLSSGEDLVAWLVQAGALDAASARRLAKATPPGELDQVARQARKLREWFREFLDEHRGKPLGPKALKALSPLNAVLEHDDSSRPIALSSSGEPMLERVVSRRWRSAESLLQPVADWMADVVCDADFTHIKHCEGHDCTLMFLDKTKGHARRWCSMAGCGNRAKQAAHRERVKQRGA